MSSTFFVTHAGKNTTKQRNHFLYENEHLLFSAQIWAGLATGGIKTQKKRNKNKKTAVKNSFLVSVWLLTAGVFSSLKRGSWRKQNPKFSTGERTKRDACFYQGHSIAWQILFLFTNAEQQWSFLKEKSQELHSGPQHTFTVIFRIA